MNNKNLKIQIIVILLFYAFLSVNVLSAQDCTSSYPSSFPITANGITVDVSFSGSNAGIISTTGQPQLCNYPLPAVWPWTGNTSNETSILFTFSSPVNDIYLFLGAFGVNNQPSLEETVYITTNSGVPSLTNTSLFCSGGTISGNSYTANFSNSYGVVIVHSPTPFTSLTIEQLEPKFANGGIVATPCLNSIVSTCAAGTTAPILSATTKANTCPATTVNLTTITASNVPSGTTLTWHTGTPATTANKVTGTAVAAGTYYAAFFDATNNCYSGTAGSATTAVTATVNSCGACNAGEVAPQFGN